MGSAQEFPIPSTGNFEILTTVALPGGIAIAPIGYLLHREAGLFGTAALSSSTVGWVVFVAVVLLVGILIDILGTYLESYLIVDSWTKRLGVDASEVESVWVRYLRLRFDVEPIGQRYLRRMLRRFKVSLNLGQACFYSAVLWVVAIGFELAAGKGVSQRCAILAALVGVHFVASVGLYVDACKASELLHRIRQDLVQSRCRRDAARPS